MSEPLIQVKNLKKYFPVNSNKITNLLKQNQQWVKAVDGVSFGINENEIFGLVGESGCGKSTLGKVILQLLSPTEGEVWFNGNRIDEYNNRNIQKLRKEFQIVFQDPAGSLNPRRKIKNIIRRPMNIHNIGKQQNRDEKVEELINEVQLDSSYLNRFPHELSGGQQQRVAIARALSVNPKFIVADEAVSALDVNVQAQILELINNIQSDFGLTVLFIAHDLSVVQQISDRVGVMYLGEMMEIGTNEEIYKNNQHPYTTALMEAVPTIYSRGHQRQVTLEGDVPSPIDPPSGCKFRTRCPIASEECASTFENRQFSKTHTVHCLKRNPNQKSKNQIQN